jgi:hypothetical protein
MGKHFIVLGIGFLGLAALAVFAGWSFFGAAEATQGGWSLGPLLPYVLGGLLLAVVIAGFLTWLATYTRRHDYEDNPD